MMFQKSLAVVLVSMVVLSLVACGNKNKGSGGLGEVGVVPLDIDKSLAHDPSQCPRLSGSYFVRDARGRKTVRVLDLSRSRKIPQALILTDGRSKWIVDGNRQQSNDRLYRANCQQGHLYINLYQADGRQNWLVDYFRDGLKLVVRQSPYGEAPVPMIGKPGTEAAKGGVETFESEKR